jgi:HEAT repeat protein
LNRFDQQAESSWLRTRLKYPPGDRPDPTMSKSRIRSLIEAVFQNGVYSHEGLQAIQELAGLGEPAVDLMLHALKRPPKSDLHPKDLSDSIQAIFCEFARIVPDKLVDELEQGVSDDFLIYWALGYAKGDHSLKALIAGLNARNQWARWAAVESLLRRKSKKAIPALIATLRDRSHMVKFSIVSAMKSRPDYRRPEALPLLERIVNSKAVRKQSLGLWNVSQSVIELIHKETMGAIRRS